MQVRFIGDPNERDGTAGVSRRHVALFGKDFVLGEAVDVDDLQQREKDLLAKHNHFEVVTAATPAELVANGTDAPASEPKRGRRAAQAEE